MSRIEEHPVHSASGVWAPLAPARARALVDVRQQAHHAAQLATAAGISYLNAETDDSHTNLEWIADLHALASRRIPAREDFRIAVRIADLTLLILGAANEPRSELALHGETIAGAAEWIRERITASGADASRYTLDRHYIIPAHPVQSGAAFDASAHEDLGQLSAWFDDASLLLGDVAARNRGASEVRCWPHHFDIATLVTFDAYPSAPTRTIGIGLEPGDVYYAEPYYYVNYHPTPPVMASSPLAGGGRWHTHEWVGAVLRGSDLTPDASRQRAQIDAFITSAMPRQVPPYHS